MGGHNLTVILDHHHNQSAVASRSRFSYPTFWFVIYPWPSSIQNSWYPIGWNLLYFTNSEYFIVPERSIYSFASSHLRQNFFSSIERVSCTLVSLLQLFKPECSVFFWYPFCSSFIEYLRHFKTRLGHISSDPGLLRLLSQCHHISQISPTGRMLMEQIQSMSLKNRRRLIALW